MSITEHEHAAEVVTGREQRARTLEAAALEIEVNGWTQGCPQDDEGRLCLMGACAVALRDEFGWLGVMETWSGRDWRVHWQFFNEATLLPLATWNDMEGRRQSDVTFLLRWRAEEIRDGW